MKNKSILIFGLVASLLVSCQTKPEQVHEQNTYKAEFVDYINISDYFTSLEYIFLEESPDGLFVNADKIIFFENRWYILDRELMTILCFAEDGKFIFRIHSVGKGPGEYQLLSDIMIHKTNKELWAQCRKTNRVLVYDLDGQLIRDESVARIGIESIQINQNDILAFTEDKHYFKNQDSICGGVFRFEKNFKKKQQLLIKPSGTICYDLNNRNNFSMYNDSCYFLYGSDSLICFPPDLNPIVTGVFDFGKYHLSEKLKQLKNQSWNYPDYFDSEKVLWKTNLIVSSNTIFLTIGLKGSSWFGIIDKKSSRFRVTQGFSNDLSSELFVFPTFKKSDDELVGYISADLLLAYQESLPGLSEKDKNSESTKAMISFIDKGLASSGNILVISKIKEH